MLYPPNVKILVIRFSSLGDIILTFPMLRKLRRNYPDAAIDFLTKSQFREAVELCGEVNEILCVEDSLPALRREISRRQYNVCIDLQNNLKSRFLRAFNARIVSQYRKNNFRKFLLVNGGINFYDEIVPVYRRYIQAAGNLISTDDRAYEHGSIKTLPTDIPIEKYIVAAPSSKHFTKTYPADQFAEFINGLKGYSVVLTGSSAETDVKICEYIESNCNGVVNLCGKTSISQLAYIISNSELVVSNDSAVMHLSEAVGKRTAAIFGSTVKEFGFYPQLKESIVIEQKEISCRPCSHIGLFECPALHFNCMRRTRLEDFDLGL